MGPRRVGWGAGLSLIALMWMGMSSATHSAGPNKAGKGSGKRGGKARSTEDWLRRVRQPSPTDRRGLERSPQRQPKPGARRAGDGVEARLDELDERLEGVEEDLDGVLGVQDRLMDQARQDRLRWSGAYRVVVNNFHLADKSIDSVITHLELEVDRFGQPMLDPDSGSPRVRPVEQQRQRDEDRWYGSNWVNRLRLTMSYDITESLRFYGQLGVFKYLNELKSHPTSLDMHTNRYPRDATLRIERAYFDWFIADWLAFTAGRVASPEGPPAELKENTMRNATWGVQMVEAEIEVLMLTIHLSRLIEGTYLRMFYFPFLSHTDFTLADDLSLFKDVGIEPMHGWGAMFELKLPHLGDNLWQLGFVHVPAFRPRNIAIELEGVDEPIWPSTPSSQDLGIYMMANVLLELKNIFSSGLDLFAAYAITILMPSKGRMVYDIPIRLPVIHPWTGETVDTYEGTKRQEIGLASYEEGAGTTNLGHMFYVGLRLTFPFFGSYAPRIGAELNRGTKYWIPWTSPSDLLVNRLGTKGWAWEVYYIQQLIPQHLFARIGYVQLIREYEGLYVGPTGRVDQTIDNAYLLIDACW